MGTPCLRMALPEAPWTSPMYNSTSLAIMKESHALSLCIFNLTFVHCYLFSPPLLCICVIFVTRHLLERALYQKARACKCASHVLSGLNEKRHHQIILILNNSRDFCSSCSRAPFQSGKSQHKYMYFIHNIYTIINLSFLAVNLYMYTTFVRHMPNLC